MKSSARGGGKNWLRGPVQCCNWVDEVGNGYGGKVGSRTGAIPQGVNGHDPFDVLGRGGQIKLLLESPQPSTLSGPVHDSLPSVKRCSERFQSFWETRYPVEHTVYLARLWTCIFQHLG